MPYNPALGIWTGAKTPHHYTEPKLMEGDTPAARAYNRSILETPWSPLVKKNKLLTEDGFKKNPVVLYDRNEPS